MNSDESIGEITNKKAAFRSEGSGAAFFVPCGCNVAPRKLEPEEIEMVDEETLETDYYLPTDDGNYRCSEREEYEALESSGALKRTIVRDGEECVEHFEGRCIRMPCLRPKPRWRMIKPKGGAVR